MLNESNFIVRVSGRKENCAYIDYLGSYKINDISKQTGIKPDVIKDRYTKNGGTYDQELDIYYFPSIDDAKRTISDILKGMKPEARGRQIILTEAEIEYIRQALINEGSNTIHLRNKVKDSIFKKLNS